MGGVRHKRECVTLFTIPAFVQKVRENFGDCVVAFDANNRGVHIDGKRWTWMNLASDMGWFDDAEIVTDENERERVMTWLNVY